MLSAWGDESGSNRALDPGAYLLGAVILEEDCADDVRDTIRSLLLRGQRKVHWYSESNRRRDDLIRVLADFAIPGLVITRVSGIAEREERRRRKCLDAFIYELTQMGCTTVTLESRGKKADDRDIAFVESQIGIGALIPEFRVFHATGPSDPLLWLADIAVGAAVAARTGEPRWFGELQDAFKTIILEEI